MSFFIVKIKLEGDIINTYMMIIGDIIVPVTPGKITTKYKGRNETMELVDGSVINKLNPPALITYSFKLLLPKQTNLPFANRLWTPYSTEKVEHMEQDYYLNYFYDIFKNNKVVLLTIWRNAIGGKRDMGVTEGSNISGDGIITSKSVTIESRVEKVKAKKKNIIGIKIRNTNFLKVKKLAKILGLEVKN